MKRHFRPLLFLFLLGLATPVFGQLDHWLAACSFRKERRFINGTGSDIEGEPLGQLE